MVEGFTEPSLEEELRAQEARHKRHQEQQDRILAQQLQELHQEESELEKLMTLQELEVEEVMLQGLLNEQKALEQAERAMAMLEAKNAETAALKAQSLLASPAQAEPEASKAPAPAVCGPTLLTLPYGSLLANGFC